MLKPLPAAFPPVVNWKLAATPIWLPSADFSHQHYTLEDTTMLASYTDFRSNPEMLYKLADSLKRTFECLDTINARHGDLDCYFADRVHGMMYHRPHQAEY